MTLVAYYIASKFVGQSGEVFCFCFFPLHFDLKIICCGGKAYGNG